MPWKNIGVFEMARFDVFRNSGAHATNVPYLLDVQCDLLSGMDTRVVVPLRRRDKFSGDKLLRPLMPAFEVEGVPCVMETPKMGAVPCRILKSRVATLIEHQADITAALDFLFQGF